MTPQAPQMRSRSRSTRSSRLGVVVALLVVALALALVPAVATAQEPLPEGAGPLEPGTFTTDSLGQVLTLTVGEGWSIGGEATEGVGVDLVPEPFSYDGPETYGMLGITRSDGTVFEGYCLPTGGDMEAFHAATKALEPTAQALADHLMADPYLETSEPVAIEIGGYSGLQLDATAEVSADCEIPRTFLWAIPVFDNWMLGDGQQARYHLIDANGEVVVFVLEVGPDGDLEELATLAQPVLDSVLLEPLPPA